MIKIGIIIDGTFEGGYSDFPWYAIRKNYIDMLSEENVLPFLLPNNFSKIQEYARELDGLLIVGSDIDLDPSYYGQEKRYNYSKSSSVKAEFEMGMAKIFMDLNKPVLGICNGLQVLNVVLGGDLIQHIPDELTTNINHEQPKPKHVPWHDIEIMENTLLFDIAKGEKKWKVNSTHHQAIGNLGKGLIASAFASDGVIEAVESSVHDFVVGIEWHPEYNQTNPLDSNIFKRFVISSAKRKM